MKNFTTMTCKQCGGPLEHKGGNEWFCPHCDTSVLIDNASTYYDFSNHHTENIKYKQCNIYHQQKIPAARAPVVKTPQEIESDDKFCGCMANVVVFCLNSFAWSLLALGTWFVWMIIRQREVLGDGIYFCSVYILLCIMYLAYKIMEWWKKRN